jgi:hypothetical protein
MSTALKQAEMLIDILNPDERVRLLKYLAPRLEEPSAAPEKATDADAAWEAFREIGRRIEKLPTHGMSATDTVSDMRR